MMKNQQKRFPHIRHWTFHVLLVLFTVVLIMISSGLIYQEIASARDARLYPPPGQLIDVGGYRLHMYVTDESNGNPTVLLDAAATSMSAEWGWVQKGLAPSTQVVTYDRPGIGYSESPSTPRDVQSLNGDLRTALQTSGVQGPYVLVGHSMGALFMRSFAQLHPEEVAGMVLVDPRYLGVDNVIPENERTPDNRATLAWQMPLAARLGVFRSMNMLNEYVVQLPPDDASRARAIFASTQHWQGFVPDTYLGDSAEQFLRQGESYGDIPFVVLSAENPDPYSFPTEAQRSAFTKLHEQMARNLSPRGEHIILAGADHNSIVTEQEYAQQIVEIIQRIWSSPTSTQTMAP